MTQLILVFAHDDIMITDDLWSLRILSSMDEFDMVGVIGNRETSPKSTILVFCEQPISNG